ncbi:50S ribosomal protein L23 [candidate division WWE3 bacterium CG06_land_8_20_14_3_00_42_16]|uniref:Large ribosomal subunit protein uL23 n=4 Tax=Katanobacteria TaxID=422282 RepID=A0A2M7AN02_UNCKA|nr:MAG: 50S ribosomal protein L23 [bacterium CG1_02_42_9]PIU68640.1 MAG: 50S ribosomal protein L23 [candidate division WWE3 bacterium CG06_land_8_20_14_3_00_42_16]PIZ43005.1 MAG: 50S ribosomal protein L23 [candidate division WWE3 bacterium CG_4_10_14_0_2_um_filter_42_8]PJA37983.1 MAG: 50S ribosomal protein L23 [candidate division WWE3 bacterium CG_4_9_14_3_um_filter_43_9]PJC69361.1 MAG: 50S ribosomal protein L23 [candidate division WWE3 bacterium CG_4_8_14_3_um_filter_42_11]
MSEIQNILLGPVISEKSIDETARNQYTFWVSKNATKRQIAQAVELQFKVDVLDVKVINIRGKKVHFGKIRKEGKRQDRRKSVVTIKPDQKIEIFETGSK